MDDDGTAWAEDQNGNWYYQEPVQTIGNPGMTETKIVDEV